MTTGGRSFSTTWTKFQPVTATARSTVQPIQGQGRVR